MPENKRLPRFFCLPVNQLLFALSKRAKLATNFSDKLNYNFYHLKIKQQQIQTTLQD